MRTLRKTRGNRNQPRCVCKKT